MLRHPISAKFVLFSVLLSLSVVIAECGPTGNGGDRGLDSGLDGGPHVDAGPLCGNGLLELGETCDDRNLVAGDG